MSTLYYIDINGKYLGGFSEGNEAIPDGAIQVDLPPENGKDIYTNGSWQPDPLQIVANLKSQLDTMERQAIMPRGAREAFIALCLQQGAAAGKTEPQLYAANPFYKGIKDANVTATAIREQIRALS